MSMSGASAVRLTGIRPIRSSTLSAALGIVSELLAKTLRSTTFRLALMWIGIFGAAVVALFVYVDRSTAAYVRSRSDHAIAAELATLQGAYASAGRSGLIATITQRIADQHF